MPVVTNGDGQKSSVQFSTLERLVGGVLVVLTAGGVTANILMFANQQVTDSKVNQLIIEVRDLKNAKDSVARPEYDATVRAILSAVAENRERIRLLENRR